MDTVTPRAAGLSSNTCCVDSVSSSSSFSLYQMPGILRCFQHQRTSSGCARSLHQGTLHGGMCTYPSSLVAVDAVGWGETTLQTLVVLHRALLLQGLTGPEQHYNALGDEGQITRTPCSEGAASPCKQLPRPSRRPPHSGSSPSRRSLGTSAQGRSP